MKKLLTMPFEALRHSNQALKPVGYILVDILHRWLSRGKAPIQRASPLHLWEPPNPHDPQNEPGLWVVKKWMGVRKV